ncbi:hypothetical protein D7223_00025 [Micromonospora endolithica]|uniref:Allene oxide cyclase barrel-like domain-containing protein n=1 Tax=Micromonospora endolithica TaxID=230091 RepID=A0A3A9ZPZ1_9ACTN|nr:hypothetical protein D7223_00025 [Micromonospora endolithica]
MAAGVDERAMEAGADALRAYQGDQGPLSVDALAVAAATVAGLHEPGVDDPAKAVDRCLVRTVTEFAEELTVSDPPETAGVGTTVRYVEAFHDDKGNRVGTMTGGAVVVQMKPHMWQAHRSVATFDDGALDITGLIDCNALGRQMTQIFRAVGTSGVYAGRAGFLAFELSDPTRKPPHFSVTIVVC